MRQNFSLPYKQFIKNGSSLVGLTINKRYSVRQELGEGKYGRVFKAIDTDKGMVVAIKFLDIYVLENSDQDEVKKAARRKYIAQEDEIMKKFQHPNILPCLNSYANRDFKIIVTPFCNEGTLLKELEQAGGSFTVQKAIEIIKQLAHAVAEIHSKRIIHRDLKLENIFKRNGYYLIGDFGLSKAIDQENSNHTRCGSFYTRAPEVETGKYSFNADIWSLGVIFYFMLAPGKSLEDKRNSLMRCIYQQKQIILEIGGDKICKDIRHFLKRSLVKDPKQRMNWKQMKTLPLFKKNISSQFNILSTSFVIPPSSNSFTISQQLEQNNMIQSMYTTYDLIKSIKEGTSNEIYLIPSIQSIASDNTTQLFNLVNQIETQHLLDKDKETQIFNQFKQTYLRVMIAKYIFDEIIIPIEENKLLDLSKKKNVQLMYLLAVRCFINMSYMQDKVKEKNSLEFNQIYDKFPRTDCQIFYDNCMQKFKTYDGLLKLFEDSFVEIVKSKIRISHNEYTYQKYFSGVERTDFTQQDQIKFTYNDYIKKVEKLQTQNKKLSDIMMNKLSNYRRINNITVKEVETIGFIEAIKLRLCGQ